MTKHLWEVEHSYYCNDGNYYAPAGGQPTQHYKTWAAFVEENGDADKDYNLVFRWDWKEGEDHDLPNYNGDDYYRNGKIQICYMGQRKGLYRWVTIEVCRADEPEVINFLKPCWNHLKGLWEGISDFADSK